MWGSKKTATVATNEPATMVPPSRPIAHTGMTEEYDRVATAIHLDSRVIAEGRLRTVLAEIGAQEYPLDAVAAYMTKTVRKLGDGWRWMWEPLRSVDAATVVRDGNRVSRGVSTHQWSWSGIGDLSNENTPYAAPVPLHALKMVEQILEKYPAAHFFVSAVTNRPKADPFLAVTAKHCPLIVIAQWDEPGFTIAPKEIAG